MRAIAFVTKLIKEDWLKDEHKNKLKYLLFNSLGKRSTIDLHAEFLDLGVDHVG